ncbi:unnamed protein product [Hermetia illucens]|uniref:Uncharacterized protein n=1 Tax=Hermetia illucens TaxID=343691 RepID=A0A7R8UCA0_HERIL|nr:unnamed protein product [Hermetia illucens]
MMRVNSPSFEEEVNTLLLASNQSDSEGDFVQYIVFESELLQHRGNDQAEESDNNPVDRNSSEDDDKVHLVELRRSNFYYGKIVRNDQC